MVIHRGALGDFVLTFPILRSLFEAGYKRRILITRPGHGDLSKKLKLCEESLDCECGIAIDFISQKNIGLSGFKSRLGQIDLVIALISDEANQFRNWIQEKMGIPAYSVFPRPLEKTTMHVTEYLFNSLKGLKLNTSLPHKDYWHGGPMLLIHPGSGSEKKNYNDVLYINIRNKNAPAEFLLGPVERESGKHWPGKPVMPESLTELTDILLHARGLISNDSGVAHLGAYLGVPTLALFKSTAPVNWRPIGLRVLILDKPDIRSNATMLYNPWF